MKPLDAIKKILSTDSLTETYKLLAISHVLYAHNDAGCDEIISKFCHKEREVPEPAIDPQEKREVEAATELFQGLACDMRGKTPGQPPAEPENFHIEPHDGEMD
jgi:hypothetical protein